MKKFGYTLAEALIAMAIIGVISATMLPLINKFKPDINKVMFLNTYDSIVEVMQSVASNRDLFPTVCGASKDMNCEKAPFYNTDAVTYNGRNYEANGAKLCQILADAMNSYDGAVCNNSADTNQINFTNPQGVQFYMNTTISSFYQTYIIFDVNGDKRPNCRYSENCTEPDRFKVLVSSDGHVMASDPMAQKYLQTRSNLRKMSYAATDMPAAINVLPIQWRKTWEALTN